MENPRVERDEIEDWRNVLGAGVGVDWHAARGAAAAALRVQKLRRLKTVALAVGICAAMVWWAGFLTQCGAIWIGDFFGTPSWRSAPWIEMGLGMASCEAMRRMVGDAGPWNIKLKWRGSMVVAIFASAQCWAWSVQGDEFFFQLGFACFLWAIGACLALGLIAMAADRMLIEPAWRWSALALADFMSQWSSLVERHGGKVQTTRHGALAAPGFEQSDVERVAVGVCLATQRLREQWKPRARPAWTKRLAPAQRGLDRMEPAQLEDLCQKWSPLAWARIHQERELRESASPCPSGKKAVARRL